MQQKKLLVADREWIETQFDGDSIASETNAADKSHADLPNHQSSAE